MRTTVHRCARIWSHFTVIAAVIGSAIACSSVTLPVATARRLRSAPVNTTVIHLQIVAVVARHALVLSIERALGTGAGNAVDALTLVGCAHAVVTAPAPSLGAHARVAVEPVEAHGLAAARDANAFVHVFANIVETTPNPPRCTVASEPLGSIGAMTSAATNDFVAMFYCRIRGGRSGMAQVRGGGWQSLYSTSCCRCVKDIPRKQIAVVIRFHLEMVVPAQPLVSAKLVSVLVIEAFAILVLGTLLLALIHSPAVEGLASLLGEALADGKVPGQHFRNAVLAGNLGPVAVGGGSRHIEGVCAATPGAVATVEIFQCVACQLVCVLPKCAAVPKAASPIVAGGRLKSASAARAVTM